MRSIHTRAAVQARASGPVAIESLHFDEPAVLHDGCAAASSDSVAITMKRKNIHWQSNASTCNVI
jgi:hypothetical protein